MEIDDLSKEEKIELLGKLLDDLDVKVTGCYGSEAFVDSGDIRVCGEEYSYGIIKKGDVYLSTDLCSG